MSDALLGALYVALGAGGLFIISRAIRRGAVWGRASWVARAEHPTYFWSSILIYSLIPFAALLCGAIGLIR
ncbi:MAG TPA: hypothetical protein VF485_14770 [Sphingomonas sp.]